ncbi:MAG: hypothetical protein QM809_01095 [Gordonia sp. (in: high G+C Gram-positive bacteria)]|uniref:hypothetical protein n=1 Tax=Gordonia sp. (in: high G+C Gram-positive bacteria) TaxID=84139 RepID=UPI0039E47077
MTGEDFDVWESRPILRHTRDFARARRVGPLPLLGALLVRAVAATEPTVVLPAVVGDHASLNLLLGFVGPSGAGKGATEAAARRATNLPQVPELPIGSGEGIARTFAPPPAGKDGEPVTEPVTRAIFTAAEVDTVAAVAGRKGSTLLPTLRSMWSGETLGAANSQAHTRLNIPAHSYRACMTIGVQPERAAGLLGDTAGTAQRMLWLPVGDPDAPDVAPACPAPATVRRPLAPNGGRLVLDLPGDAVAAMQAHRLAVLRGEDVDPLDGHKMLTRAKLAAAFMLLDSRLGEVSIDDWELAGWLIHVSDRTRARIERDLADAARRTAKAKARATVEHDEEVAARKLDNAKASVVRWLTPKEGEDEKGMGMAALRRRARGDRRDDVAAAVAELVDAGIVAEFEAKQGGKRYRLAGSTRPPVHPLESPQVRDSLTGGPEGSTGGPSHSLTGGRVDRRVDTHNRRSETGGTGGRVDFAMRGVPRPVEPVQLDLDGRALPVIDDDTTRVGAAIIRKITRHGPARRRDIQHGYSSTSPDRGRVDPALDYLTATGRLHLDDDGKTYRLGEPETIR